MLLKSIKLENFRQFVDEQIDFSTDLQKNVTLIIGDNGTGKTTFAQAFFWCLYGTTDFNDSIMLNRHAAMRMTPDEQVEVRVTLRLTHGEADYEIIRKQKYQKSNSNKVSGGNTILSIAIKAGDGNTRYLKPSECELEIKKILPQEFSRYFFFDGERIEKMSKEIASGRKSSGFSEAVTGLTGLKGTLSALGHLNPNSKNSVIGRFDSEYSGGSNQKVAEYTRCISALQDELNAITKRLAEIDDSIQSASDRRSTLEEDIKQYEDGARLQAERDKLEKDLVSLRNVKGQLTRQLCNMFNDHMSDFFSASLSNRCMDLLATTDFLSKDIPEMHSKTVHYLLKRGQCICGTDLKEGSMPYKQVAALLDYLPPQSIGVTVGQFVRDTRQLFNKQDCFYKDFSELIGQISRQDDEITSVQNSLIALSDKLNGQDVRAQVRSIHEQIQTCRNIEKNARFEKERLLEKRGATTTEKNRQETERAKLTLLDQNNRRIEIYKAYASVIYSELQREYRLREKEIREKLQEYINEIFKTIYDGGLSLSIDDRYNISVYVTDYDGGVETSTAQSISVIFAFISSIIRLARENKEADEATAYSEPYPLVMDAPLSAFDKRRIAAICNAIPETAEQVIIFIKDTDGDIANEYLGEKVKTRHYFEKIDEFRTVLH